MDAAQPFLHHLLPLIHTPFQVWSQADGAINGTGAEGIYCADTRIVSALTLSVDDCETTHIHTQTNPDGSQSFTYAPRLKLETPDPRVTLTVTRSLGDEGMCCAVELDNGSNRELSLPIRFQLHTDQSDMASIKMGNCLPSKPTVNTSTQWVARAHTNAEVKAQIKTDDFSISRIDSGTVELTWNPQTPPAQTTNANWTLHLNSKDATLGGAKGQRRLRQTVANLDLSSVYETLRDDLHSLLSQAAIDLDGLTMHERSGTDSLDLSSTSDHPTKVEGIHSDNLFFAAGAPWFFTLFGRDSLISALFVAPYDPTFGVGTLRTLARRQGTKTDPQTAEQPGKILHEVRCETLELRDGTQQLQLPPLYYGSVDATALWVILFADLWKRGLKAELSPLIPALVGCLDWIYDHGDADGDGYLEYIDTTGHGLANQGWKDSGDSVRWLDGSLALAPIALCEVQGYAVMALTEGASIIRDNAGLSSEDIPATAFDSVVTAVTDSHISTTSQSSVATVGRSFLLEKCAHYETRAADLKRRFALDFWVHPDGSYHQLSAPYPAVALDGHKRPVNSLTSNIGHLLGTGILDHDEELIVAQHLRSTDMNSGYGIRTMSAASGGYHPLSYHCGSVWVHDNGMILRGMMRAGLHEDAAELATTLLRTGKALGYRYPELFGGQDKITYSCPVPYPASCHPQAWSAATAFVVAQALGAK